MTDRLMLLDTSSLYFRAFHGLPESLKAADGTPVNAVRGLLDMIARLVTDFQPTHLIAAWDDNWRPAWRVELIPSYKAHRVLKTVDGVDIEETPEGLVAQLPLIREMVTAVDVTVVGAKDYEADDVIGTLATQADMPVDIVTGDRDLFQLVDDARGVRVIYTARGMSKLDLVTDAFVVGKHGVLPSQYADYAVLRGDTSDGLPGVAGIGEKTAAGLLQEYGDLDGVRRAADDRDTPMAAGIRSRITAAAEYLAVAPRVVNVARDLDLGTVDGAIRPLEADALKTAERLGKKWNLGGSLKRALKALGNEAAPQ